MARCMHAFTFTFVDDSSDEAPPTKRKPGNDHALCIHIFFAVIKMDAFTFIDDSTDESDFSTPPPKRKARDSESSDGIDM